VGRVFSALRIGLENLQSYYKSLTPILKDPDPSRYFPSLTCYEDGGKIVEFEYVGYLENDFSCTTLRARTCTSPPRDIVVKFVQRPYGASAHEALAEAGLAPRLLYCGTPSVKSGGPLYGEIEMVVMEYVDGETVAALKNKKKIWDDMKDVVRSEVRRALQILHEQRSLVFGDLRGPNVMVTKDKKVKLIDFDWAGVEGQATYPSLISDESGKWAEGVVAGGVIQKKHDLEMLEMLVK
jgi:serine/threonine protein kinase